jgi:diguanylate cyclase (GGDEF)-like protein
MNNNNTNQNRPKVIALCMGGMDSQYQSKIIDHITKKFLNANYKVLLFQSFSNSYDNDNHNIGDFNIYNLINYNLIDAVVLDYMSIKRPQSALDIINEAKKHDLPIIVIDSEVDIEGTLNLSFGYSKAITTLTNHLIEKHHVTRINFMAAAPENEISVARETAYRKALESHGISVEDKRISYGYFWNEPAKAEVKNYYEKYHEMPQAFVCANDSMAIGVCQGVQELGFEVPRDVLVTGLDGILEAINYSPKITTVGYNFKELSNIVFDTLNDYFEDNTKKRVGHIVIEGEVMYSSSCGCASIDYHLDNQLKRDLYSSLDFYKIFSMSLNNLVERAAGASSLQDTIVRLQYHILKMWAEKVWLCLNETYLSDNIAYSNADFGYTINGYDINSNCVVYRHNNDCTTKGVFRTSNLLPDFEKELRDNTTAIMFCPLNNQEKTIGYIATTYNNDFYDNLFKYCNLLKNIVMILENSKIQNQLKSTINKLENMYIRDSMTSIYNRRGFYQLAPSLISKCFLEDKYLMVISVDLDGLKPINDIYGHNEGDNAIITVAKTLNSIAINNEIVSRFGGDEYVVAGMCDDQSYAENYVSKLNDFLNYYNENSHKPYKISASSGIYCTKVGSTDEILIDDLIKYADESMYTQKQASIMTVVGKALIGKL